MEVIDRQGATGPGCVGPPEPDVVADADSDYFHPGVKRVTTGCKSSPERNELFRRSTLRETLGTQLVDSLPEDQSEKLCSLLEEYNDVFCLEEGERGETDLVEMHIDTGDASPRRQPVRRVPFAVRQEVARQLREMQDAQIIQPWSSPWASPIVLVRKKDGTLRYCIDYRDLNSVTKSDLYPLPRIDDLLDQLGKSRYFSTLDLAAGYWQIKVDVESREKTAFITRQGLFEFQVMPFGLTNAPAVFQRLMEKVLHDLNPEEGPDFVEVYIDDVLIFSRTIDEHLEHLKQVLERLRSAGLKLKPTKCHFIRQSVDYLGHVLTPAGLKTNAKQTQAVREFPVPGNLTQVRQFLGLTSYYRRFIKQFAAIASPLHNLTKKDVTFHWSDDCQMAFETLKQKLTSAPILVYPDFALEIVLETDASAKGLGAVLSQPQKDGRLLPVAYASRSLSAPETIASLNSKRWPWFGLFSTSTHTSMDTK